MRPSTTTAQHHLSTNSFDPSRIPILRNLTESLLLSTYVEGEQFPVKDRDLHLQANLCTPALCHITVRYNRQKLSIANPRIVRGRLARETLAMLV